MQLIIFSFTEKIFKHMRICIVRNTAQQGAIQDTDHVIAECLVGGLQTLDREISNLAAITISGVVTHPREAD
jgi:hypothetical protein